MFFNSRNAGEDVFASSGVKVCCILNSNLIFGSVGVVVAVGELVVVMLGGDDVPVTGGVLALP